MPLAHKVKGAERSSILAWVPFGLKILAEGCVFTFNVPYLAGLTY